MRMQEFKAKEFIDLLLKNGWEFISQNGSHKKYKKHGCSNHIAVPIHKAKELSRPLTQRLLREAGIRLT